MLEKNRINGELVFSELPGDHLHSVHRKCASAVGKHSEQHPRVYPSATAGRASGALQHRSGGQASPAAPAQPLTARHTHHRTSTLPAAW